MGDNRWILLALIALAIAGFWLAFIAAWTMVAVQEICERVRRVRAGRENGGA